MIIFRTDASADIGFGHIKRSSYLASLLKNQTEILFCIGSDKIAARYLEEKNFSFHLLHKWELTSKTNINAIIFDLRHFDERDKLLLQRAREWGIKTVQITDLGLSQQPVDYTIDAALDVLFPYAPGKTLLNGPAYALLHNKFRHFNKVKRKYRRQLTEVFICFGGGADYQRLRAVIDFLSRHRLSIKIAPGFYLKPSARKTLKRIYPRIHFVGKTDSLARAFFEADVAIITAGVAAFEAAAVGTPALYYYYHDEQKFIAQSFEKQGVGSVLANIDDIVTSGDTMLEKLHNLTLENRVHIGNTAKQLVDARGVYRILDFFKQEKIL